MPYEPINEPDSHIDIELTLEVARDYGWEGDDVDWEEAAEYLREARLSYLYPERL